jgi:hypothetical protein
VALSHPHVDGRICGLCHVSYRQDHSVCASCGRRVRVVYGHGADGSVLCNRCAPPRQSAPCVDCGGLGTCVRQDPCRHRVSRLLPPQPPAHPRLWRLWQATPDHPPRHGHEPRPVHLLRAAHPRPAAQDPRRLRDLRQARARSHVRRGLPLQPLPHAYFARTPVRVLWSAPPGQGELAGRLGLRVLLPTGPDAPALCNVCHLTRVLIGMDTAGRPACGPCSGVELD